MNKISILTGSVHSGKTTKLMHWASSQTNIDGIFQPIINDNRFFYHIGSRTLKILEASQTESDDHIIPIGNYRFSKNTFVWAQKVLLNCLDKDLEWIIIDEIGPLELQGAGLEPVITKILIEDEKYEGNILCVVRESILEKFIAHYKLQSKFQLFELH